MLSVVHQLADSITRVETLESGHHELHGVMSVNVLKIFFMVALGIECCIAIIFLSKWMGSTHRLTLPPLFDVIILTFEYQILMYM